MLIVAHSFGYVFERFRLPRVVGEICGGLLIGPSVLGLLVPQATGWLVPDYPLNSKLLSAVYWLGLILLMFTAGFRVQQNFIPEDRRSAGLLLVGFFVALVYRFIGSKSGLLSEDAIRFYDRIVFPVSRAMDTIFYSMFGKNLMVEARRV